MNKRIKCLLVAGLLVVGMNGMKNDVFAAEPLQSTVKNITFEEGLTKKVIPLQNGYITVTITKNDDGTYKIVTEWDSTVVKVTGLQSLFENGDIDSDNFFDENYYCHLVVKNGDMYSVTLDNLGEVPEGFESMGDLSKIDVKFELVDSDGDGVPDIKDDEPEEPENPNPPVDPEDPEDPEEPNPPVEPEEPEDPEEPEQPKEEVIDPETGDASMVAFVSTIAISAAGIYVINRKKDEE